MLPGQAKKFIRLLIKKSMIMPSMNVYGMVEQKQKLNKIRFGSRVLKAGTVGQALPSGDRVAPDLTDDELDSQLFKCEVLIQEEVFEDNIEQAGLRNTIMQMLGEAISRDIEWVIINGDTASSDATLAKLDGLLERRRQLAARYDAALSGHPCVRPPWTPDYAAPNFQSYAVSLADDAPLRRDELVLWLRERGVGATAGIMLAHRQPIHSRRAGASKLPRSEAAHDRSLLLPLYPQLAEPQQDRIVELLWEAFSLVPGSIAHGR